MTVGDYKPNKPVLRVPTLEVLPCGLSHYQGAKIVSSIGIVYYTLLWFYSTGHLVLRVSVYPNTTSYIGFAVHIYAVLFNLTGLFVNVFLLCALVKVRRRMIGAWLRMKAGLAAMRVLHVSLLISALVLSLDFPALSHLPLVICNAFWSGYSALVVYSYYMRTCGLSEDWSRGLNQAFRYKTTSAFRPKISASCLHDEYQRPKIFTIDF